MKRLVVIGIIWFGCAIAWMVLGTALVARSGEASGALTQEVHRLWGPPMQQRPPKATLRDPSATAPETAAATPEPEVVLPVDASDIAVALDLEQRQKGLLWFPTYTVDFRARYTFTNTTADERVLHVGFPLQEEDVVYDGFTVTGDDGVVIDTAIVGGVAEWSEPLDAGQSRTFTIAYRSRGTSSWHYQLTAGTGRTKSFRLAMSTDFDQVNFPAGTLSPSTHSPEAGGWKGEWSFSSLIANAPIGIELPQRTNPGPLASRITFFAPVGLLFFFFVVAISSAYREKDLHPLNYFFFGCAFFAFHLLLSYLVDHLPIAPSIAISSTVSVALVVSYARLFAGWKFALREMGISQLLYLVLFSLTFLWTGFTGLSITVGAILSLFVMMQLTGRASWAQLDRAVRRSPDPDRAAV
jgi:hypothetical protein